jgi:hypothetical protein
VHVGLRAAHLFNVTAFLLNDDFQAVAEKSGKFCKCIPAMEDPLLSDGCIQGSHIGVRHCPALLCKTPKIGKSNRFKSGTLYMAARLLITHISRADSEYLVDISVDPFC